MTDPYDLQRFVDAQDSGELYARVLDELRGGRKTSHWMWFVFPQVAGLGRSPTAEAFGISGLPEAKAYLAHPVLGPRLRECSDILVDLPPTTAVEVFGTTDAQKLRSSMTLFAQAEPTESAFRQVLDRYFAGEPDPATLSRI
jgi:uncharacterized protein (DUF1810 family)